MPKKINTDSYWMQIALHEAKKAEDIGEIPVGAVIIRDNEIIAGGHNLSIANKDPTAHAEIIAIRNACRSEGNYRLPETTIYVTLEPCTMCLGAMIHARIERLVFGATDSKSGVIGGAISLNKETFFNHSIQVSGGIMEEECGYILKEFFRKRRKNSK